MKFERTNVYNIENAIHGMRHPLESYDKSDTGWYDDTDENEHKFQDSIIDFDFDNLTFKALGPNDKDLAQRLLKAGSPHDKFMRQIFVSVDITAPLYFWKELDTYKVGTTANSTSTMHKLSTTPITWDCFEHDDCTDDCKLLHVYDNKPYKMDDHISDVWDALIDVLETLRLRYLETKDKRYWKELIRLLPESWLQTRTWTANYAVLRSIYKQRQGHKLTEWKSFCEWIEGLPCADSLLLFDNN